MKKITVGIIGVSKRMQNVYPDVLKKLINDGKIEVTAICNRTKSKAIDLAATIDSPDVFISQTAKELFDTGVCDLVIISYKGPLKQQTAIQALESGQHVFLETPAAAFSSGVKKITAAAEKNSRLVQVAEDFAFFPEIQLARKLQQEKGWGEVIKVENNYSVFSYHAFALLGSLSKNASSKRIKKYYFESDERFYHRKLIFENLLYREHYPHDRSDSIKKEGGVVIEFENGLFDSAKLLDDQKSFVKNELSILNDPRKYAIHLLLQNQAACINNSEEELLYPIVQAVNDITLWRSSQLQVSFPLIRITSSPFLLNSLQVIISKLISFRYFLIQSLGRS